MKRKNNYAIVGVSLGLLGLAAVLGATIAGGLGQANLLELEQAKEIALPLSYEKHISKGDNLRQKGFYELAIEEYQEASSVKVEHPEAHEKMGHSQLALGNYTEAIQAYQRAFEITQNNTHGAYLTEASIHAREWVKAEDTLQALDPESQEFLYLSALLHIHNEDFEAAKTQFTSAQEKAGHFNPEWIQNFLSAYEAFADQQSGQDSFLHAKLVQALVDSNQLELAEELSLKVLNQHANYRDVWILLGYSQLQMKNPNSAEEAFKQAKALDPIKAETHYFLGLSHYQQEEYQEAIESFELALLYNFEPQVEVYRKLAESQLFTQDYDEALSTYEYLIKVDSYEVDLFVRPLWIAVEKVRDLERALSLAEEAVERFPEEALSHNLLASVLLEQGKLNASEEAIYKALEIDSRNAQAHYTAGELREAQGNTEGAKWEYKKAHELAESGDKINQQAADKYNSLLDLEENARP